MATSVDGLLAEVREALADLPPPAVAEALAYYEEYVAEAREAGKGEGEILARLGSAEEMAAVARSEASLVRAEAAPGPASLMRAARGFRGAARKAARLGLVPAGALPYTVAMCLYVVATVSFIGGLAAVALGVLAWIGVDPSFPASKVAAVGLGLTGLALLVALGAGLWWSANVLARLTLGLIRAGLGRPASAAPVKRRRFGRALALACAIALALGLASLGVSGVAGRYFSIWNSRVPAASSERKGSWDPAQVASVRIETLNSRVEVVATAGHPGRILATYTEPDWMRGSFALEGGKLLLKESSAGRLPFLDYAAIHEGMGLLRLELPEGWVPGKLEVASVGGHIELGAAGAATVAKTRGDIRLVLGPGKGRVAASAQPGRILVDGVAVEGTSWKGRGTAAVDVELSSWNGTVKIESRSAK